MLGVGACGRTLAASACVVAVVVLAGSAPAATPDRVRYSTGQFAADCNTADATPQICDPARKLRVRVREGEVRIKRLRYVASTEHCSAARVLVSLDGDAIGRTDFVNAGEQATVDDLRVTLDRGRHSFRFRVEGRTGGCNAGFVGSWGGKITLRGTKRPA